MDFNRLSWKTASAGIVAAVIALIGFISSWMETGHQPDLATTTVTVAAVVNAIGLLVARDNDKTSREVGATQFEAQRKLADLNSE